MERKEKGILENILYEDKQIIVCSKKAGTAVQTARLGEPDMETALKNHLKSSYIGIVHRLDQPVEGILVFAKTKNAAAELSRQSRGQIMNKKYYAAVLLKKADAAEGQNVLVDYLQKENKGNISRVISPDKGEGKRSELSYEIVKTMKILQPGDEWETALLRIQLKTGRHHQIRVQTANAGMPILGDTKYGNEESKAYSREMRLENIALCAYCLEFSHPVTREEMIFHIAPSGKAFLPFLPINS